MDYDFSLSGDAARTLLGSSRVRRKRAEQIIENLANDPFREPDSTEFTPAGRTLSILVEGNLIVTFWVDHAVKEVRVIRVEFV